MIDVSIIVPVYNVEKYLKRCLDSLVNQDYDDNKYEIIVINDASKDKSLDVIKDFQQKYKNIILKDLKENKGVSHARNLGIKSAKGEFLLFCDSDDFYSLDSLKIFMNYAKKNKSDFVMANYNVVNDSNVIKVDSTSYYQKKTISKKEAISYMTLTSCSKLIKKSLFINNKIFYPEDLKKCEELTVIPVLAYLAEKPIQINQYLYNYYQRSESASNSFTKGNVEELLYFDLSFNRMKEKLNNNYYDEIEFRMIDHLAYGKTLVMLKSKIKRKEIIKHINSLKKEYPKFIKNKYFKKYNFAKKIFVYVVYFKLVTLSKLMAFIHTKMLG